MTARTPAEDPRVEPVARALYDEGVWCADCAYEGWGSCAACRRTCTLIAVPALAAADAAAPRWSCGRCDSFAARGFDDGQIPEHHSTCRHAGVGAGPQGDALTAVLELCDDWSREAGYGAVPVSLVRQAMTGAEVSTASVRSDLTGLGAREAGHTVYPTTDARSADQDVTG